jgi:NAD(P)-dependent dehydrogenase (short-subunit alcohol dehydrogenase family)
MVDAMPDLAARVPVGRLGEPDDVAACVTFLLSDHASYITGAVLDVNGGFLIH